MKGSVVRCKAFMLDWDGTLVDSLPLKIENAAGLFAQRYGADYAAVRSSYARHSGMPRRRLFDRIAGDCVGRVLEPEEYEALSRAFSQANLARIPHEAALRPGVREALAALHGAGALLFVSTSAAQEEIGHLGPHFGIDVYCRELLGSAPGFSKGRDHAAYITRTYAISPRVMAGVGDDVTDVHFHREAGVFSIGITGTRTRQELEAAGMDLVVDDLRDLVPYAG